MNNTDMTDRVNSQIEYFKDKGGFITDNISDGYHTFGELYKHRIHLFIALCYLGYLCMNDEYGDLAEICTIKDLIKSKKHFDGSEFEGWFIIQLETSVGQISYHLPDEYWDECEFIETVDKANEWDGHTSDNVLERLLLI